MIAALIDKELARKARGERYAEVLGVHLERQMQEIREHAEFCKRYGKPSYRATVDRLVTKYETLLADITNEGHRLMTLSNPNAGWAQKSNCARYTRLDEIAEKMYLPARPMKPNKELRPRGRHAKK